MSYREKLMQGLKQIQDELLDRVESKEEMTEEATLAAGYLCGYIENELQELAQVPPELWGAFDAVTKKFIDQREQFREEAQDA